ncbi:hypothetical protein FRC12_016272 [Ceratobasidium sp. 428]|nr:hypothetical protein FRC12_016272 [Ceratobasidium sp. 428]
MTAIEEVPMHWCTLRSEFLKCNGHLADSTWKKAKMEELEEWHEHGFKLEQYLNKPDVEVRGREHRDHAIEMNKRRWSGGRII